MKRAILPLLIGFLFTLFLSCKKDKELVTETQRRSARLYVVLGSSTAAGVGAGTYDSSWVGRSISLVRTNARYKGDTIINLAASGYSTTEILPAGDKNRNITKALSFNPYAIIINMPSNDIARGGTVEKQMNNFATIAELARQKNVVLWVTTSQPRNLDEASRKKLIDLKDRINAVYGSHAIDFWTEIANPDGRINTRYNSGDGIHVNAAGHRIFFSRVVAKKVFD